VTRKIRDSYGNEVEVPDDSPIGNPYRVPSVPTAERFFRHPVAQIASIGRKSDLVMFIKTPMFIQISLDEHWEIFSFLAPSLTDERGQGLAKDVLIIGSPTQVLLELPFLYAYEACRRREKHGFVETLGQGVHCNPGGSRLIRLRDNPEAVTTIEIYGRKQTGISG
jgi:hypothetical protein